MRNGPKIYVWAGDGVDPGHRPARRGDSVNVLRLKQADLAAFAEMEELELFERWRAVRALLEMTQREVAAAVGVNLRTIKGYEHPDQPRGSPGPLAAERLVATLAAERSVVLPVELFTAPTAPERGLLREIERKLDLIMSHLGIEDE